MTQLHRNFQFASLQVSRANATAFYFCYRLRGLSKFGPTALVNSLRLRPPTVCDGNFRGVLYPRVFFSIRTRIRGSNRAGRPLFKTLSKPADRVLGRKSGSFLASNLRVSRWIGVRVSTFVYLNSKKGRSLFRGSFVRRRSSSSLMPSVF